MQELTQLKAVDLRIRQCLAHAHQQYVSGPSPVTEVKWAISLELSFFLWQLLEEQRPDRILDLGTGFSSFVFRLYCKTRAPGTTVWTIDNDDRWLDRTQAFLSKQDLSIDNMTTWDRFDEADFDLTLHDLGIMKVRASSLERVVSLTRRGGLIVLDDLHFPSYAEYVKSTVVRLGFSYFDVSAATKDCFGRYSGLIEKV